MTEEKKLKRTFDDLSDSEKEQRIMKTCDREIERAPTARAGRRILQFLSDRFEERVEQERYARDAATAASRQLPIPGTEEESF